MKDLNTGLKLLCFFTSILWSIGFDYGYAQVNKKSRADTTIHCGCSVINYAEPPQQQHYSALSNLISYTTFEKFNQWKLPEGIKSFNLLLTTNGWSSGNGDDFYKDLSIVSPQRPIRIAHPDGTFTLNLTPCADRYRNYILPISIKCKPSIANEIRGFDYNKFENTTLEYTLLYFQISRRPADKMIRLAFKEWAQVYGLNGVNQAIAKINSAYNAGIMPATEKNYRDSLMISAVLDSLVSKKLIQEQVFNTGFILSEPSIHPPTYYEKYYLEVLFQDYCPPGVFDLFNIRKFFPDYYIRLKTNRAAVEISTKILSPATQHSKSPQPYTQISIEMCSAFFNNESMIRIDCISDACLPSSVIAGTTLAIDFDHAGLYSAQLQTMPGFDCSPYPQFAKDTSAYKAYPPQKWELYDKVFTHFTGLLIQDARFRLPYGKTTLLFKGKNVIINNRVIAGCITIDLNPKDSHKVVLKLDNGRDYILSISKLLMTLNKQGLNGLITKTDQKQLYVYFKKINGKVL